MWFDNLKIKWKLLLGFASSVVLTIALGVFSYVQLDRIDKDYSNVLDCAATRSESMGNIYTGYNRLKLIVTTMVLQEASVEETVTSEINALASEFDTEMASINEKISTYLGTFKIETKLTQELMKDRIMRMNNLSSILNNEYMDLADSITAAVLNQDQATYLAELDKINILAKDIDAIINYLTSKSIEVKNTVSTQATIVADNSKIILVAFIIASVILAVVIALVIANLISKPIKRLVSAADDVASGNLNVNLTNKSTDEIGLLSNSFKRVVDTVNELLNGLNTMSNELTKGDIDFRVKESAFSGDYKEVVQTINKLISDCIHDTLLAISCMTELKNGNFTYKLDKLPGKKIIINQTYDELIANLTSLSSDINVLITEASNGNLNAQVPADQYKGDWGKIVQSLDELVATVNSPIQEVSDALTELSKANLNVRITHSYLGAFGQMKDAFNLTVENTSTYIKDISSILEEIAKANLNLSIDREYIGDFRNIKVAMNTIIEKLNDIMGNINSAASQVSVGAKSISESSMTLATGASEQASSVEELTATIDTINEQTRKNAESAESANRLSKNSKANALAGNEDMKKMLVSMEEIKDSSSNISRIIKTIEDIAFQTNLLALNAAVEAARAGQHGKGFAVVAEEVRNLAARSQTAAKETASMIEDSITKVNQGTQIAQLTADSLETIVRDVDEVSAIISDIAVSSEEQASSISQITLGLSEISNVVQINSTTSEESAAAAEELSSQSETLSNMVSVFSLKKR